MTADSEYAMSERPPVRATVQSTNFGPAIFVGGFLVAFFTFNSLGQDIARETQKALRERIKEGDFKFPSRPGEPRKAKPAEVAELDDDSVVVLGMSKVTKKIKESKCLEADVLDNFALQYVARKSELVDEVNKQCIQDKIRGGVTPQNAGEVGFMVKAAPQAEDSALRIITHGWPTRGKELEVPLKVYLDWLAAPHRMPTYKKVSG